FLGFLAEIIFNKFNIPDILLLIGVGIGIGTVLEWADATTFGEGAALFSTFALVFILFQGALSIDFKTLIKSINNTFSLTVTNFILTVCVVSIIGRLMGYDLYLSLLLGMILGGTSSAVVIPLVKSIDIKDKYGTVLTIESALSDVLCIIGTVTILEIINTQSFVTSEIFNSVFSSFSKAILVGVIVGIIWIIFMSKNEIITKSYMLTIALLIGIYVFVESPFIKASGAIAALSFGLVLGNSRSILQFARMGTRNGSSNLNENKSKNKKISSFKKNSDEDEDAKVIRNVLSPSAKNFYSEISFFVKVFFFVYLGILIDFSNPKVFIYGALLTLGIYLIRPISVKLVFGGDNLDVKERTIVESLIPKGLAAAVLAGVAVQTGVLGDMATDFVNTILSVILLSIVLTSILIFLTERGWFKGFLPFLYKKKES
ncbi:MAG: cation:proton antiporter, partial [Nanoarchaeota archaeon]|nr:cation:proton antiporter [Nanoarchaeota archaeon]